ncbi:MAG: hypothetical protein MK345_04965 [SAR202 cluster bacterium]|nr:hypothetical protein [SAR202 cluster bacterium]|tara:strand:- start:224 stop:640 length:417 start_codon:yes stop_codon:yes gene_type:complete
MDVVIAGIASGLLFASILISVGCFVIFQMYRNNVIWVVDLFKDTTASKVIYPIIIFLNPTMAIFGVIFGFIFIFIDSQISIKFLGSPNIIYTFVIIGFSLISFIFIYIISPKYWRSFLGILITFDAIFGWLIPILSSN